MRNRASRAAGLIAVAVSGVSVQAAVWNLPAGGTWNAAASWTGTQPNATGDNATFNNAASGSNPAQTGNRAVTADGAQTVGSINFNNDAANTFTNSITTGTGGSLIFDETGAGPATINVSAGTGTGNNTISAPITLTDSLVANVNHTAATSAAGALNLTATMSGGGGFTKNGDGLATFGTGAKTYTGATVLNGGRTRMSLIAHATATSSMTINAGGQLTLISAGTFSFGAGTLNLNGVGATSGPFAAFPGAIRNDTNLAVQIDNPSVVLQSDTLIHVQGATTGSTTFTNSISGPGRLTLTAVNSNTDLGQLVLNGNNSYAGGTTVNGGNLVVSGAAADLGSGNVEVKNVIAGANARLTISTGVANAIDDLATLILEGGGAAGVADQAYAILGAGINDTIAGLVLGGVTQTQQGTYGSTASAATFQSDEYFSGTGVVTLAIPEPTGLALIGLGAAGLLARRRGSR